MRTVLNILNFVLGGFLTTLGWLIATLFSIVLIITLPLTRSCWEITKLSLLPYGNEAVHIDELEPGAKSSVMNAGGTYRSVRDDYWYSGRYRKLQDCRHRAVAGWPSRGPG